MLSAPPARSREDLRCSLSNIIDLLFQPFSTAQFEALHRFEQLGFLSMGPLKFNCYEQWHFCERAAVCTSCIHRGQKAFRGKGMHCARGKPYRVVSRVGTSFNHFLIVYFP